MGAADPTPEELQAIAESSMLEKLNTLEEFQFFKRRLLEIISGSYEVFLGSNSEQELWRSQGEARMADKLYRMVEDAGMVRQHIQREIHRRSAEQAAAEMAALDLDGSQRVEHFRRTRRPVP